MNKYINPLNLIFLSLSLFSVLACGVEFDPSSLVQEMRVLSIKAEPPEVSPGSSVTFTPLVTNPSGDPLAYRWMLYGDASFMESPGTSGEPAGDPLFTYEGEVCTIPIPPDLLVTLGGLESVYVPLVLQVSQGETVRQAFKGLLISENETSPNRNPRISGINVNGILPPDLPLPLPSSSPDSDSEIEISVILDESRIDEGDEMRYYWYSDSGEFKYNDKQENTWTAPEEPVSTYILAVTRDDRGGTDWFKIEIEVIP